MQLTRLSPSVLALLLTALSACGATAPESETPPASDAERESSASSSRPAAPCAEVSIGLDLRVLPSDPSPSSIEHYVSAQADRLVGHAQAGEQPRVEAARDHGAMRAWFDGSTDVDAIARCERTVDAYLASAPRLPVLMEPAADVTSPCRACAAATAHD